MIDQEFNIHIVALQPSEPDVVCDVGGCGRDAILKLQTGSYTYVLCAEHTEVEVRAMIREGTSDD